MKLRNAQEYLAEFYSMSRKQEAFKFVDVDLPGALYFQQAIQEMGLIRKEGHNFLWHDMKEYPTTKQATVLLEKYVLIHKAYEDKKRKARELKEAEENPPVQQGEMTMEKIEGEMKSAELDEAVEATVLMTVDHRYKNILGHIEDVNKRLKEMRTELGYLFPAVGRVLANQEALSNNLEVEIPYHSVKGKKLPISPETAQANNESD